MRWPGARVTGVDTSPEMLEKAAAAAPEITWQLADLGAWKPARPVDVIYSNAALHWLEGHQALFAGLFSSLAPGGVLAVQMPRNFSAPSHTSISDAAQEGRWRAKLEPLLRPSPTREPAFYYGVLAPRAAQLDIWETEYLQVLDGDNPVKEWTKGTWLRPLLAALDEPDRTGFESAYAARVARAYRREADGRTHEVQGTARLEKREAASQARRMRGDQRQCAEVEPKASAREKQNAKPADEVVPAKPAQPEIERGEGDDKGEGDRRPDEEMGSQRELARAGKPERGGNRACDENQRNPDCDVCSLHGPGRLTQLCDEGDD